MKVELDVNGRKQTVEVEPRMSLLDCLRDRLSLNGAHAGCEHGVCGACTVRVGGVIVRAEQETLRATADALASANEEFRKASALKDQFLANMSHELRTPLSRIRLGIDLLQQSHDPAYKTEIERNIAELDQMIDEILSAPDESTSTSLHAASILREVRDAPR